MVMDFQVKYRTGQLVRIENRIFGIDDYDKNGNFIFGKDLFLEVYGGEKR
jgi:hypothetical protein